MCSSLVPGQPNQVLPSVDTDGWPGALCHHTTSGKQANNSAGAADLSGFEKSRKIYIKSIIYSVPSEEAGLLNMI